MSRERNLASRVSPGFFAPRVTWIELRGVERATGTPVSERLDKD
jgi:hypothetical protein